MEPSPLNSLNTDWKYPILKSKSVQFLGIIVHQHLFWNEDIAQISAKVAKIRYPVVDSLQNSVPHPN